MSRAANYDEWITANEQAYKTLTEFIEKVHLYTPLSTDNAKAALAILWESFEHAKDWS